MAETAIALARWKKPGRDGDKKQARRRVNYLVEQGRIPKPNSLPCSQCGHLWSEGERRHEYDHHLGYAPEHQLDVVVMCTECHRLRELKTHCKNGHAFDDENTIIRTNYGGSFRVCKTCDAAKERRRGPRGSEYWRKVNARRKKVGCG